MNKTNLTALTLTRKFDETICVGDFLRVKYFAYHEGYVELHLRTTLPVYVESDSGPRHANKQGVVIVQLSQGMQCRIGEEVLLEIVRICSGFRARIRTKAPRYLEILRGELKNAA